MIKLKEIKDKYGDYLIDEDKLKDLLIKPGPKTVWDLKDDDKYCYITALGDINYITWVGDGLDLKTRETGNAVLTIKEAELELERRKCEAIMLKYGRRTFKCRQDNWNIKYEPGVDRIDTSVWSGNQYQGTIYFDTEELARKAINEIGEERFKKYIFRVEK